MPRRSLDFEQVYSAFAVHQIGAHESNQFEEAMFYFGDPLQHVIKATAIWMRTAFSERPMVIRSICLIRRKKSSICQRVLQKSAISSAGASRSFARMQREKMITAGEAACKFIAAMLMHKPLEYRPVNQLEQIVKHAILMPYGVGPFVSR